MSDKDKLIKWLRHIGDDFDPQDEDYKTSPECGRRQFCPEHQDCGICRIEYMKKKGWLNPAIEQ